MTVIDAQVYIWGIETPERSWLPGGLPWCTATLFTEELDFLSDIDKTWIMGRGIAAWLGWAL